MESQEEKHFTAWNTTPKSSGFYITIAGKLCCLLCQIWAECIKCRGGCSHSQQCLSSVGVPGGSGVKNLLPAMQEIQVWPLVRKVPWRRKRQPTPAFLPGKPHGQRRLAGGTQRSHKESATTQQLKQQLSLYRGQHGHTSSLPQQAPDTRYTCNFQRQCVRSQIFGTHAPSDYSISM